MSDTGELLIGIEDLGACGQITLRGDLAAKPMASAVKAATGLAMPGVLGMVADGDARAVWMSPDELLLIMAAGQAPDAMSAASKKLAKMHHMALDVSDARSVLRLTGALVGEVLAKGAPCDCSDKGFPPGTARRTHLGGLAVGIWRLDAETWEVMCFRSYTHHLQTWLAEAAIPGSEVRFG